MPDDAEDFFGDFFADFFRESFGDFFGVFCFVFAMVHHDPLHNVAMTSSIELAEAERRDLLALAESLTPEQWAAPSLCAGWSVQDVVTHVVSFEDLPRTEMAKLTVQARGNPTRLNDLVVERTSGSTEELVDRLRRHLVPTGLTAQFGGRIALTDGLIHRQDVRRPLGLGTDVPHDRLASALTFAMVAPTDPRRGPDPLPHAAGDRPRLVLRPRAESSPAPARLC